MLMYQLLAILCKSPLKVHWEVLMAILAIYNITRPLFGDIEGGSAKDLLLENVNIDMPELIE